MAAAVATTLGRRARWRRRTPARKMGENVAAYLWWWGNCLWRWSGKRRRRGAHKRDGITRRGQKGIFPRSEMSYKMSIIVQFCTCLYFFVFHFSQSRISRNLPCRYRQLILHRVLHRIRNTLLLQRCCCCCCCCCRHCYCCHPCCYF
jgi:hypothetical protein